MDDFSKRLEYIFSHFRLTSSQFADSIGVQKSNISHILSERNKPSLDFILKIREAFPVINLYWLIYGTGPFLTENDPTISESKKEMVLPVSPSAETGEKNNDISGKEIPVATPELPADAPNKNVFVPVKDSKTVTLVMLFYTDGTFDKFEPR